MLHLDLDISIVNGRFKYKLFDKRNAPEYKNKINITVSFSAPRTKSMSNLFATFLDLDISIVNQRFKYKISDKRNAHENKNKVKHIVRFSL